MGYDRFDRGRGEDRYSREREQGRLGDDRDRGRRPSGSDDDRGFFDRAGDEVRSWFGDEEAERRRRYDERYDERSGSQSRGGGYDRDQYNRSQGFEGAQRRFGGDTFDNDRPRYGGAAGYGASSQPDRGRTAYGAQDYGQTYGDRSPSGQSQGQGGTHDPHYSSWRDRQMQSFDRDYEDYRRENQSRFENEFGSYRTKRQGQREMVQKVNEHMEVVGSDGQHIGTVDHVRGERILLTKTDKDAGGHHHTIPSNWIESVDDKVHVSKTADEAKRAWREEKDDDDQGGGLFGQKDRDQDRDRDWQGGHNLNRSFSGTY